ncbi:tRNA (guanine-N(7)-)-methyltransferase [Seminavis robusta]|uniref:tRNA (guanine(46)-N(7))-methyltransferase n=1 Tax=Seminavis robusta TaxID=568900 RepID=A0A9N8H2H1_9STRA|nr:tRNA (guanine-N(7)-)-methyltransferase [Seminavis robusta]|eukprot:Sro65_g036640.1 tRNA (guanine-N(7)-)-methyltransferase (346) ;mRNA; r:35188-36225
MGILLQLIMTMALMSLLRPSSAFILRSAGRSLLGRPVALKPSRLLLSTTSNTSESSQSNKSNSNDGSYNNDDKENKTSRNPRPGLEDDITPPWTFDLLQKKRSRRNNVVRVRQHVNPLARRFQLATILTDQWPTDVYDDVSSKPLFLDIGVGKGGFLLHVASQRPQEYNYLGLEIRPLAVQFAKERLQTNPAYSVPCTGHLDFVGCNANVDLGRLLNLYREANDNNNNTPLAMVTIQFPDPHFKASHAKRRVVTPELVRTLPQFMPPGGKVFLQSDVQTVLDDMRERFREESMYFTDQVEDISSYYPDNIIGIPTEREVSVLKQDLPVYRALFVRTETPFDENDK